MHDPKSEYFEDTKQNQKMYIKQLWELVKRFSELKQLSADERFRVTQFRQRVAMVARVTGVMDRELFNQEMGRHMQALASAMGGVAGVLDEAFADAIDLPDPKNPNDIH